MPREQKIINKFEGGIQNHADNKDIPDNSVESAVDAMFDIGGQIRLMGRDAPHAIITDEAISGYTTPGYGLFSFNTDFSISTNKELNTKALAIQQTGTIGIYDGVLDPDIEDVSQIRTDEIDIHEPNSSFGSPESHELDFYYVDGTLRLNDGNFNNPIHYPKSYKYIDKTWFSGSGEVVFKVNNNADETGDWMYQHSYLLPPSVNAVDGAEGSNAYQLFSRTSFADPASNMADGNISLLAEFDTDEDTGEWLPTTLKVGVSFQYDDGQESQVTPFYHSLATTVDNTKLTLTPYVRMNNDPTLTQGNHDFDFPSFVSGVNYYYIGDDTGDFADPLFLGYFHFGTSAIDTAYFETHEGNRSTETHTYTEAQNEYKTAAVDIETIPVLTYEIRNGYNNETKSIFARRKASVIANRRAYIGAVDTYEPEVNSLAIDKVNVEGYAYSNYRNCAKECAIKPLSTNLDRMIKSPVNKFDTFPEENFVDVAINDGESIIALHSYADRILQFKQNNVYVLNISEDYEYLEAQYKYAGIQKPYQIAETRYGIAWVNHSGCYLWNGEGEPTNLIEGKLDSFVSDETNIEVSFKGWNEFIGISGMVGYIPRLKQLVVLSDPVDVGFGNVMIYDFTTKSWAFGHDRVTVAQKSNIINNYDNSCMFIGGDYSGNELYTKSITRSRSNGLNAQWILSDLNFITAASTFLKIGDTQITDTLDYPASTGIFNSFADYLFNKLESYSANNGELTFYQDGDTIAIIRDVSNMSSSGNPPDDIINDTYSGETLAWDNTGNITSGVPTVFDREALAAVPYKCNGSVWSDVTHGWVHDFYMFTLISFSFGYNGLLIDGNQDGAGQNMNMQDYGNNPSWFSFSNIFSHWALTGMYQDTGYTQINFQSNTPQVLVHTATSYMLRKLKTDGSDNIGSSTLTVAMTTGNFSGISGTVSSFSLVSGSVNPVDTISAGGVTQGDDHTNIALSAFGLTEAMGGGDTTKFYTGGQPGESGALIVPSSTPPIYESVTVTCPSVVFRNLHPRGSRARAGGKTDKIEISILGDQSSNFVSGGYYNITNADSNENNLTKMRLSYIQTYIDTLNNIDPNDSSSNVGTMNQVTLTVLTFMHDDQTESSASTDPLYGTNWVDFYSYGDTGAVTFTYVVNSMGAAVNTYNIDNTNKFGDIPRGEIITLHPNRNGYNNETGHIYNTIIKDHSGVRHTISSGAIVYPENSVDLTNTINNAISDKHVEVQASENMEWASNHKVEKEVSIKFATDTVTNGARGRVNFDMLQNGIIAGDTFKMVGFSSIDDTLIWRIKQESINIHGADEAGYSQFDIANTASEGADGTYVSTTLPTSNSAYGDGTFTGTMKFSTINIVGKTPVDSARALQVNGNILDSLVVQQFINDVDPPGIITNWNTSNFSIKTKRYDFDNPGYDKTIYYIDISYKFNTINEDIETLPNTGIKIFCYGSSGQGELGTFSEKNGRWYYLLPPSKDFTTVRMYFNPEKTPIRSKTFQLFISAMKLPLKNITINDITIHYRKLSR